MTPNLSLIHNGRKFMWDGKVYANTNEASPIAEAYRKDRFEVVVTEAEGRVLIYTRRLVSSAAVDAVNASC
ncbi:MAG: hypothetical protein ACXVZV_04735 [Terriglobales bacterium]